MTVCLHCRHAEREAARERRRAIFLRAGVLSGLIALLVGGAVAGAGARQDHSGPTTARVAGGAQQTTTRRADSAHAAPPSALTPTVTVTSASTELRANQSAPLPDSQVVVAQAGAPAAHAAPVTQPAPGAANAAPDRGAVILTPVIPDGRTELGDSLFAIRTGDTVQVHFDTQETRTRRRDKFERIVRTTLPRVYGAIADSALAAVPDGSLTRGGGLVSDLPRQGLHVSLPGGRMLVLWPETRPGRDGPLVVSYRAVVRR